MKHKARARWDYSRMKLADFPVFAQHVVKSMTGNIHFQNPVPDLQTIQNSINILNASISESANRDIIKVAERQADRKIVERHLRALAGWLRSASSDREILMTSGMEVAKPKSPLALLSPPREMRTSFIRGKSGCILLRWRQPASQRAALFTIEQADGNPADDSTSWRTIGFSKKCRFIITGLVPGKTYSWRTYGLGSLGSGGKSFPVSVMVI